MTYQLQRILEFHDLYPEETNFDIDAVLKKYDRLALVRMCQILSFRYHNARIPNPTTPFFSTIKKSDEIQLNSRLKKFLEANHSDSVHYCTSKTALELLRHVFAIPIEEYRNESDVDIEYNLFRVLLKINEHIVSFTHSEKHEDLSTLMFLLGYTMNDIYNENIDIVVRIQLIHYSHLSNFLKTHQEGQKVMARFLQRLGIHDMCEYATTIMSLIGLWLLRKNNQDYEGCHIFDIDKLGDTSGLINQKVLDYISIEISEIVPYNNITDNDRDNNVDYRIFRSKPIIKLSENQYIICNKQLLAERLYSGLFFDLKNEYKGDWFHFYNTHFVERALFHRQISQCLSKHSTSYFPQLSMNEKEESGQPDFYIRENDNLILFECKSIKINGNIREKKDIEEVMNMLKLKLYSSSQNIDNNRKQKRKTETVGVTQLVKHMKLIDGDEFPWDDDIPDRVAYYPVIVLEDARLITPGLSGIINQWYKDLIDKELPGQMCYPIIVMSMDTLILYTTLFHQKGFFAIFDKFFEQSIRRDESPINWEYNPVMEFNDWIKQEYKVSKQYLGKLFDQARSELGLNSQNE